MVSLVLLLTMNSTPAAPLYARPEIAGSSGSHWLSVSPGASCENPATW